jgi:hypothetical protein
MQAKEGDSPRRSWHVASFWHGSASHPGAAVGDDVGKFVGRIVGAEVGIMVGTVATASPAVGVEMRTMLEEVGGVNVFCPLIVGCEVVIGLPVGCFVTLAVSIVGENTLFVGAEAAGVAKVGAVKIAELGTLAVPEVGFAEIVGRAVCLVASVGTMTGREVGDKIGGFVSVWSTVNVFWPSHALSRVALAYGAETLRIAFPRVFCCHAVKIVMSTRASSSVNTSMNTYNKNGDGCGENNENDNSNVIVCKP